MPLNYQTLRDIASIMGLRLWKSGGYYYLSGLLGGKHSQGIFRNLASVEAQLRQIQYTRGLALGKQFR